MEPKISVVVPVYKVEKYLDKCVNSLLHQTYKNMDIILVDDGSPDTCPEMCDRYAAENDCVFTFHKPNGGLSDARNYGVQHTDSAWIVFVDSDDYVEPAYVETLVNLRNQFDAEMVITRTARENEDGTGKQKYAHFDSYVADKKQALYQVYDGVHVGWSAYGKLFPREVLLKHPFPLGYYEDCACMYKIINEFDRIAIGDFGSNYHYIQRDGSILLSALSEKHLHIFDIAKEFETFIREVHPDLEVLIISIYRSAVVQILNLQRMPWATYKDIFMRYRPFFRKNLKAVLQDEKTARKRKIFFLFLCGRPEVFYLQRKIIEKMR